MKTQTKLKIDAPISYHTTINFFKWKILEKISRLPMKFLYIT